MKKTFGILIIICLSIFSCSKPTFSSDKKNDISEYGLKGNVKSLKSELYNLIPEKDTFRIGEKINGISFDRNSQLEFNHRGNLTSTKEFLADGKISFEIEYIYDKRHRLISKNGINHYGKGSIYNYEFSYNEQDSIIEGVILKDNFKRIHKMKRDNKSRIVKKEIIQSDSILGTYIYVYDQKGNLMQENDFKKKNILEESIERTFDINNLLQKEKITKYIGTDTITYQNLFFYNKNMDLIKSKMHIENDSIFTEINNKYFENGTLKESQQIPRGSNPFVTTTQKLNENGNLIEYSRKSNDETINDFWTFKFKYDHNNNWIEKIEFKNNQPLRIVKRTIEYYK